MIPADRVLFIAWQDPRTRAVHPVARLLAAGTDRFEFTYIRGVDEAMRHGFMPFPRMNRLDQTYYAGSLRDYPLVANRMMPTRRPDFADHIARLGLGGNAEPVQILGRSEGRKATDNLEVFAAPVHDAARACWVYHAFARGIRYLDGADEAIACLRSGDPLAIEIEVENPWDGRARAIAVGSLRVGWVPGALLDDLDLATRHHAALRAEVARVNLSPAPVQQRLLVRIEIEAVPQFQPMSGPCYQPIPPGAIPTVISPGAADSGTVPKTVATKNARHKSS